MDYVEFIKLLLSDGSFNTGFLLGFIIGGVFMWTYKEKEIDKIEKRRKEALEEIRELREAKDTEIKELKKEIASLKIALSANEFKL